MPKIQFSDLTIKNIKFNGKQTEYSDSTKLRGVKGYLCLLVGKNSKTFAVRYRVQGKRKRFALGFYPDLKLKQARVDAVALLVKVTNGFDPALGKKEYREAETFADLWEQYIKSPSFKAKVFDTQKEDHRRYNKRLKKPLGDMKLVDIRKKHLSAILSPLAEKAPIASNRLFSMLSVLFKLAFNKDLIEQHPMFGMDKPAKEKPRHRYLSKKELQELWPAFNTCRSNVRDIFKIILLTCQRPGEVMGMRWTELDLDKEQWTIPAERTKGKSHDHIVPLSPLVMKILQARVTGAGLTNRTQWMLESEFVFPTRHNGKYGHTTNLSKARYKLIKGLNMDSWGAHDLRRTGRTMLSELGVAPNIAERILNHSMGKIEGTYDIFGYLPQKAEALDKLSGEINRLIELLTR